jgi:hypothetical protein
MKYLLDNVSPLHKAIAQQEHIFDTLVDNYQVMNSLYYKIYNRINNIVFAVDKHLK